MKHFFRASKYIFRYRLRFVASLACVGIIAAMWVGSFTIILPFMKIFMSDEGLHGWIDRTVVEDRLDIRVQSRNLRNDALQAKLDGINDVAMVVKFNDSKDSDNPLAKSGVLLNQWIVGVDKQIYRYEELLEKLSAKRKSDTWQLLVYDVDKDERFTANVQLQKMDFKASLISSVGEKIKRPETPFDEFILLVKILVVLLAMNYMRSFFRVLQTYISRCAVNRGLMDLRNETYSSAVDTPLPTIMQRGPSDTISRFVADFNQLSKSLMSLFGKTMVEPAKMIFSLAAAFALNWKLTVLTFAVGPVTYLAVQLIGKLIRKATRNSLEKQSSMLQMLEETINGMKIVKSYNSQESETRRFRGIARGLYRQQKRVSLGDALSSPIIEALGLTGATAAVILGAWWVFIPGDTHTGIAGWFLNNPIDAETFLAVLVMLVGIFDPVRKLSKVTVQFYNGDAAAERIFELRDEQREYDPPQAKTLPRHKEDIQFKNIVFSYPNNDAKAIDDVSFAIEAGKSVAIVGANGSGKTTLLNLLLRFFEPSGGQILIDSHDITEVTRHSLRSQIGLVTQEAVIFKDTVAANIAYGHKGVTRQQIIAAAKQAFADEFITAMADGYDTIIGEHGSTLSGGQRQRIAIARAILRDPAILIMDEAMSQIDSESEAKINEALGRFMVGRTTLMIAHRFSTVVSADMVIVMQNGRLIATGKHEQLRETCSVYKTLFESQLIMK